MILVYSSPWYHPQVWEINPPKPAPHTTEEMQDLESDDIELSSGKMLVLYNAHCSDEHLADTMIYALSKFVSIPSVSSNTQNKEDCRQAAIWLRKTLGQLGAQSFLVCLPCDATK